MKNKISSMTDEEFNKYIRAAKNTDDAPVHKENKEDASGGLEALFAAAAAYYGISDEDELAALIARDLESKNTDEDEQPSRSFAAQDDFRYAKSAEDIQNDWIRQSEALKKIIPDFDPEEAFANPDFYRAVVEKHQTLAEAYPLLEKKQPRRAIAEIGNLSNGVAGSIKHDVKTMSDKEFDEYIKKIKNS